MLLSSKIQDGAAVNQDGKALSQKYVFLSDITLIINSVVLKFTKNNNNYVFKKYVCRLLFSSDKL